MIAELAESELDELACAATPGQAAWATVFASAALDQAPGEPTEDDVDSVLHDALAWLISDPPVRIRVLEHRVCPASAGRAWARIRNGSDEVLVSELFTGAARDLGRIRLG